MPLLLIVLLVPVVVLVLTPLTLIQRYRMGKARRPARKWAARLGVFSFALSAVMLLIGAAFSNLWISHTLVYTAAGLAAGCVAGVIGLLSTTWEAGPRSLHYTPNRWIVLLITLLIAGRALFGFYRTARTAGAGMTGHSMVSAFGVPESFAVAAVVIGYYLAYNTGVLRQLRR